MRSTKRRISSANTAIGSRTIAICWRATTGYLFTGDFVYKDTLFAYYPSTDPQTYLQSLEKVAVLPARRVFPAHHTLDIQPEILIRMRDAFCALNAKGKLHHGSGTFDYGDLTVTLEKK